MKKKLELMADRIETTLEHHAIPARVTGGTVTPRWVRFQVLPAVGAKISDIKNLSEELAAALGVPTCRVSRRGAAVAVEVARDDPYPVRLLPLLARLPEGGGTMPAMTAVLGLAEDGAPLLVRLPSPDVGHILVAGEEGAGKTSLLQTMVLSLAMMNKPDDLAFIFLGDGLAETSRAIRQAGFPVHRVTSLGAAVIKSAVRTAGKRVVFVADDVMGGNGSAQAFERLMKVERHHYILAWEGAPPQEMADLFKARLVGQGEAGDFIAIAEEKEIRFHGAYVSAEETQEIGATQREMRNV